MQAILAIVSSCVQTFEDLTFVAKFVEEVQLNTISKSLQNFSWQRKLCNFLTHECIIFQLVLSLKVALVQVLR